MARNLDKCREILDAAAAAGYNGGAGTPQFYVTENSSFWHRRRGER